MPKPLFVTNTARCGSGLIARMLTAGNEINIVAEGHLDLFRSLRNSIIKASNDPDISSRDLGQDPFFDYFFSSEHLNILDIIQDCPSIKIKLDKSEWNRMYESWSTRNTEENKELISYYEKAYSDNYQDCFTKAFTNIIQARNLDKSKLKWIGIKDSWIIELFLPLARTFPDAKFLVILRDPRGSIASNQYIQAGPGLAHVLSFSKSWRKHLAFTAHYMNHPEMKGRIFPVVFDHFVREPDKKAQELCDFFNVEFHPSMLNTDNYIDYATGNIWKGNSSYEKVTKGISSKRSDRWRETLNPKALKLVEFVCDPDIRLLNLEPTLLKQNEWPDSDILEFLIDDSKRKHKWRNDFKYLEMDYGFELFRKILLNASSQDCDSDLIRRAFLFEDVFLRLKTEPIQPII